MTATLRSILLFIIILLFSLFYVQKWHMEFLLSRKFCMIMSVREGRYVSISIPNLYLPTALVSFLLLQQITRDKQL